MAGAFSTSAWAYFQVGCSVIPTGGADGKKPCIRGFMKFAEQRAAVEAIETWAKKFPDANVGILTGPVSDLTVVDIDQPGIVDEALRRFGPTPVIDVSPRGGNRLFYRYAGEKTLNRLDGAPIDVRAKGGTPLLIGPPSVRPDTGAKYKFIRGGIADLADLPSPRAGSLPLAEARTRSKQGGIPIGTRNRWLFRQCLQAAPACDDLGALFDVARTRNEECDLPLSKAEVVKTTASAWHYELRGENWVGQEPRAVMKASEHAALTADEYYLLGKLRIAHACRDGDFLLSTQLAADFGWTRNRYYAARAGLITKGYLKWTIPPQQGSRTIPRAKLIDPAVARNRATIE